MTEEDMETEDRFAAAPRGRKLIVKGMKDPATQRNLLSWLQARRICHGKEIEVIE